MTEYYDKNGKVIREFDVLKVFHFIGARRKKHYIYKWITGDGLRFLHLDNTNISVPLSTVTENINGKRVWTDAEIVQTIYEYNI